MADEHQVNQKYRILSIDGGGMRGLYVVRLLQYLDEAVPGWLDKVDLFAGTSTGGILALALAYGLPLEKIKGLYYDRGGDIFKKTWLQQLKSVFQLFGAKYDNQALIEAVFDQIGPVKLKELPRKVLIPAFDLDNNKSAEKRMWSPKFFHNFPGIDSDGDREAYKVALYTSAAPTYFPAFEGFVDGGVVANNPAMAAVAQTQDVRAEMDFRPTLDQIRVLSISTGTARRRISKEPLRWGLAQWAQPLINIMLDGVNGVADYQCQQLLGKQHYHRVNYLFKPSEEIELDDAERRDDLLAMADQVYLGPIVHFLQTQWL